MAVHIPLTKEARREAEELMMATRNLLKPANGEPITIPNKEMAMGVYYHTVLDTNIAKFPGTFANKDEAYHAYQIRMIGLRQAIDVRLDSGKILETTVGRLEYNDLLPASYEFMNEAISAKKIKTLVTEVIKEETHEIIISLIDNIKNLGFRAATLSGLSVSVPDCEMIVEKAGIIEEANKKVESIQEQYFEGMIAEEERKRLSFDVWIDTTDELLEKTWKSYDEANAIKVIIESGGTRASKDQVKQLAAMRGLVVDPLGNIVEMPTKSNFREGLSIFEYVTSARGSRKGLTDSAIKTADAGYLTRRLCDVSHDVIIRMDDCGTDKYVEVTRGNRADVFANRITGRVARKDITDGKKVFVTAGEIINAEVALEIEAAGLDDIAVRSPLTCEASKGMCRKCYGWDFSTRKEIEIGVPVGIVAAQSIGEPGTQLTMRTKHKGGIVGGDVTQGLPRVEELLEVRNPKSQALISEISGKVTIKKDDESVEIIVRSTSTPVEEVSYTVSANTPITVSNGDLVATGTQLTAGSINAKELMQVAGLLITQQYLIEQVQAVYESQGIPIHDKHFEVILRKMSDKVQIESSGDTDFLTGEVIERNKFVEQNDDAMAAGGEPATAKVLFLGITRSSLFTSSWLSAASFQHTKNVLTNAASAGAVDYLEGLKENVIIGRLIPTSEERARIDN
ncbi:MAG: DNA-directed RNA polymerase subunit beta', partial [Candidatus Pacebacteria bacterium]|nr:DNA-directed RNA polymerase subunit beta' [Candidatus Paceibacterota bacterium]